MDVKIIFRPVYVIKDERQIKSALTFNYFSRKLFVSVALHSLHKAHLSCFNKLVLFVVIFHLFILILSLSLGQIFVSLSFHKRTQNCNCF